MITDLIKLIAPGEGINLKLDALKDGRVRVTIVPRLGEAPEKATDEQTALRELLSSPLHLTDLPATLDGNLRHLIAGAAAVFSDARQQIATQVQGLQKALADAKPVAPAQPGKAKPHQKPLRPTAADKDGITPKQDDGEGLTLGPESGTPADDDDNPIKPGEAPAGEEASS